MLKAFQGHTLETALLKPGCTVLDVGCRGFGFGTALRHFVEAKVYEVDIDDLGDAVPYYRCGIAAVDGFGGVTQEADPEARHLVFGNAVPVYTIESFGKKVGVDHWDVIKLDCEGTEYDILWNLTKPPADQLSVEFHQHTPARRTKEEINALIQKLEQWYTVQNHQLYGQKPETKNYWDSLFVIKGGHL